MKGKPIRDKAARRQWETEHNHCQVCWYRPTAQWMGHLETHHLVTGRSDEPCNWLRVCHRCHYVAINGGHRETSLTRWDCLGIKRLADPDEWDPFRLAVLLFGAEASAEAIVDRLEPVPEWVLAERDKKGW